VVGELGDPIPGANVVANDSLFGAATDIDGQYLIIGIPVGRYAVTASFVGYTSRTDTVTIHRSHTTQHDFALPSISNSSCKLDSTYRPEDLSWQDRTLPALHTIAEAYGLNALDEQGSGPREVRLWRLGSWGPPWPFVQMIERDGVRGDLGVGWSLWQPWFRDSLAYDEERLQGMRSDLEDRCGPLRTTDRAEACTPELISAPDWEATLRAMEEAGLWTLPDETVLPDLYATCPIGYVRLDGTTYIVELFDGTSYRAYSYWSPREDSPWPEEVQAARIVELFDKVIKQARPR
jgi:hypothetical protein